MATLNINTLLESVDKGLDGLNPYRAEAGSDPAILREQAEFALMKARDALVTYLNGSAKPPVGVLREVARLARTGDGLEGADACLGIAFWETRKPVSMEAAAAFLRWQALCLDGSWDETEFSQCMTLLRNKAILV